MSRASRRALGRQAQQQPPARVTALLEETPGREALPARPVWGFLRGGAGGTSLGKLWREMGFFVFLFWVKCFWFRLTLNVFHLGLRSGRREDGRRLFPERGREVGQLKGSFAVTFLFIFFFPVAQRKAGDLVCVPITFSRCGLNVLKGTALGEMCCRWCPF